jgi:hypothetical protein
MEFWMMMQSVGEEAKGDIIPISNSSPNSNDLWQ